MKEIKPKFKLGDTVCIDDEFHFNPAYKVLSIGRVEAIFIHRGRGILKGEDKRGVVMYDISGFSLIIEENKLKLYEG